MLAEQSIWGPRTQTSGIGVRSVKELALRPEFSPQSPGCHRRRDLRYEAGSLGYWV